MKNCVVMIIMIYLKIRGRLGNQLFQYATVNNFRKKFYPNEELALDFTDLKKLGTMEEGFKNSLNEFNVEPFLEVDKIKTNIIQAILIFIMKIPNPLFRFIGLSNIADIVSYKFEKFMQPLLNKFGVYYMIHGYYEFKKTKSKNKIFYGNFECCKYFDNIRNDILEMYSPKIKKLKNNSEMYKKIKENNSVCITIRRGDFVTNSEFSKIHYICSPEFFYKAIDIIKEKVDNPFFVVFSDDIDWVKTNMNFGERAIYESGSDPLWEKLRLMSSCKHFIISNSTFSWWAQYLSVSKNKVVVAPNRWKNISYKKDSSKLDIYQDFWYRVK